jgi:hypothetical protein
MRKLVVSALCVTFLSSSMYSASAGNFVEFRSQTKNFGATFSLQQNVTSSDGSLAPGKTDLKINIGKVIAQFESTIRFTVEDEDGNQRSDVCRATPRPNMGISGLTLNSGNAQLLNVFASIEISDQPEFNRDEAETYFQISMSIPLTASGRDYLDLKYDEAIYVVSKSDEKQLTSKHITRAPGGGYSLAPMSFNIQNLGTLYVKTVAEFTQEIDQPKCPSFYVGSWSNPHTVSTKESFEEIQISKLGQVIQNIKPSDLPLTNKIFRLKFSASSGLPVTAVEADSSICIVDKDLVYLLKPGKCAMKLSQEGNDAYEAAPELAVAFTILGSSREAKITCVKGKLTKVVSGSKPVCPAGYKKK